MNQIEEKSYRFLAIKGKSLGIKYDYMLYCDSIQILIEHNNIFQKATISSGINDLFERSRYHANTPWRGAVENLARIRETTILEASQYLEDKVIQGKINALLKYGNILLRENGTYMVLTDSYEIYDEKVEEKLVYPTGDFTIRVFKWEGGTHWYAKVGKFDVVDEKGDQKWYSKRRAQEEAENFLLKLKL